MENSLVKGDVFKVLIKFTIPFLLSCLLQNLYGTVDLLVIGNYSVASNVSAVATGSQVMGLITQFILGITTGATVLIGQYLGANKPKKVAKTIGNSIYLFTIIALLFTGISLGLHELILEIMNIPLEASDAANTYTIICSIGIPLIVGYNTICAILRGLGDIKSPLYFVLIACFFNIVLDIILAGYMDMGAAGVAIATVVAQGISFIIGLFYLYKKGIGIPFSKDDIKLEFSEAKRILLIGIPLGVKSIIISFSFMMITAIINKMGVLVSAAMGVGDKIVNFAFLPQSAFATSISVMVAQNMGANQPKRAIQATQYGMITCVIIGILFTIFQHIYPTVLPALFTKDTVVQQLCGEYVKAYSYDSILTSIVFCLSSMFTGCGKSTFTLIQDLVSTFGMRVPATYFLSKLTGVTLYQLGLAAPAASFVSIVICLVYLKSGKWKEIS